MMSIMDYLDEYDEDAWADYIESGYDEYDAYLHDAEFTLAEWKDEIVTKIVEITSLTSAYVREVIDNDFEDYFWDDYSTDQIIEMFLEEENESV
jgi:hypothetical protein